MVDLRKIIPSNILKIIRTEWQMGDRLDMVIDHMNKEIHEANDTIFKRHKKFIQYGELEFDGKTVQEAIDILMRFNRDDIIEIDEYIRELTVGGYEDETDDEYATRIYPLFRSYSTALAQQERDKKELIEERKNLKKRLKEIDKMLKND